MKAKLIAITIVLVGIALFLNQFGLQITTTINAKKHYSPTDTPEVYLVPTDLPVLGSSAPASTITNSACIFSTPWNNPTLVRDATNLVLYTYQNGVKIIVETSEFSVFGADHFRDIIETDEDKEKLEYLFGTSNLQSNYAFINSCFQTTPDQISLFNSEKDALQKTIFLLLKSGMIPSFDTHTFYRYDINKKKGFQFGDPTKDKRVHLICFTSPDSAVGIGVGCSKTPVSQEDINCIIRSVKNNANQPSEVVRQSIN